MYALRVDLTGLRPWEFDAMPFNDYHRIMDATIAWREAKEAYPPLREQSRMGTDTGKGTVKSGEHEFAKPPAFAAIRADGTGPQFGGRRRVQSVQKDD